MKKLIDTNEWYARVYVSMPLLKEKENAGYDLNLGAVVLNCEGRTFVLDSYETSFTSEAEEGEDFELCSKLEIDLDTFPVDKEFNGLQLTEGGIAHRSMLALSFLPLLVRCCYMK